MHTSHILPSPVGPLELMATDGALTGLGFGGTADGTEPSAHSALPTPSAPSAPSAPSTPLLCEAARQIDEYFAGLRRRFTLPLAAAGTPFQQEVWRALGEIPYGQTRSYAQVAAQVGRPRACRAVGMANHRNPIAIVTPCHRVVGSDGALTGYAGGMETKRRLLALERAVATIPAELADYLAGEILPRYAVFDRAHDTGHALAVAARSLDLAIGLGADPATALTVALYHDTGLAFGRERHHIDSGRILAADATLRHWFSPERIDTMREAAEDHRASSERAPRSLYGRIVAEADRQIDPATILRRTIQYGLAHAPALDREGHYARTLDHLERKYAEGGYLRLWIPGTENARQLDALRRLIANGERLRALFDALYEQVTGLQGNS